MSEKLPLYPSATLAHLFNLSERRVQQLAKEGIIPKARRGKYELVGALRGYTHYLQKRVDGQASSQSEYTRERLRLMTLQADEKEQAAARLRSNLIANQAIDQGWQQIVDETQSAFLPLSDTFVKKLNLSPQAGDVIAHEFSQVLENLK